MELETEINERLAALSLEDKVSVLTGATAFALRALPQAGLRRMVVSDGPVGVRGETWDEHDLAANLPSPTAIAASWNRDLVHRIGQLLAAECRRKGVDVLLAPTVNLHRSPLGGRHFECFSEDPLLTAQIGGTYVQGLQQGGVAACVKHFVGNDSETERMSYEARIDERALRELYLAPFEHIVAEAGVWSVMAAYNKIDGVTMTESPLLGDLLGGEWDFDGLVVSDWNATRSTAPSANAALDLVMPGPDGPWGQALIDAVREGAVPESTLDEKVRRILRLAARVGALEGVEPVVARPPTFTEQQISSTVREAASAGFVLAQNDGHLLPLDPARLRSVAVLGPNATSARIQGGGSATVFPPYVVSPLDGLRSAFGDGVRVEHAVGARGSEAVPPFGSEVAVRFLDADGRELGSQTRNSGRLFWMGWYGDDVPAARVATIEARATYVPPSDGAHTIGLSGAGHYAVEVGGTVVLDGTVDLPEGADPFEAVVRPPNRSVDVDLAAGREVEILVRHTVSSDLTAFSVGCEPASGSGEEELAHAAALAADADVAVVVVGTTAEIESEGFDRSDLALPGRQDELVDRVRQANPHTVVVVNAGAPVELPWADDVPTVLLSWFGGQEYGNAIADVLLGASEPGGRLPTTWPKVAADAPVLDTQPVDGVLSYDESLHLGYRGWQRSGRQPRYAFGHGLGYTTWTLGEPDVDGDRELRIPVRNTGVRRGRTVVQAYASRPDSDLERPASWLVGFADAEAEAGQTVTVRVPFAPRAFCHWDAGARKWATEPGAFTVAVGTSSANLGPTATVEV